MSEFILVSSEFEPGTTLPRRFTCEGQDISPPLNWSDAPPGTASFALICEDPDAPGKTWTHWLIYNLPPDSAGLGAGVPTEEQLADGSRQGVNDFGRIGYGGPCPPRGHGAHRYIFTLYALNAMLNVAPGASKAVLRGSMDGHILGEVSLMGRYAR